MKAYKINKKSIIVTLLIFILVIVFLFSGKTSAFSSNNETNSNSLEDREFALDSVIVIMNSNISEVNKKYDIEFFSGVAIESIKDLTEQKNNLAKSAEFKQILKLYLKECTKENVLITIEILINKMDDIFFAQPNYYLKPAVDPNDDHYLTDHLWNLNGTNGIKADVAWNFTRGSSDVKVGVLDSGVVSHPDLNANLITGWDSFNNNTITTDVLNSHGTHVAGIIGAIGDNSIGVTGINWNTTLVPLQATDTSGVFQTDDVVEAICWANDLWGTTEQIDIINFSVSHFGSNIVIREAVREYNGLFIWAAGNEMQDIDQRIAQNGSFDLDNLISVGAINKDGTRRFDSNFSSNNRNVNIYAPGTYVYSTVSTSLSSSGYLEMSGTSMAAPHVSGVAALMLSVNPNLTAKQLKKAILNNVDILSVRIPTSTHLQKIRKLNAFKAVYSVAFETEMATGGVSITGLSSGTALFNNMSLVLPNSFAPIDFTTQQDVVAIGDGAFNNQTALTEITVPSSIISIGSNAFLNCTDLNEIIFETNNIIFGATPFSGCGFLYNKYIFISQIALQNNPRW